MDLDGEAALVGSTVGMDDAYGKHDVDSASDQGSDTSSLDQEASAPHTSNMPQDDVPPLEDMTSELMMQSRGHGDEDGMDMDLVTGPRAPVNIWDEDDEAETEQPDVQEPVQEVESIDLTSLRVQAEQPASLSDDEDEEIEEEIQTSGAQWLSLSNSNGAARAKKPIIEVLDSTDFDSLD